MNNVREVNRINEKELELAVEGGASWHDDYKDSAYIFVGNLDKRLTDGDVITIFSQYGEILDINLPRIPEGGLRDRNSDNPESSGNKSQQQQQQQQQQAGKPGDRRGFGFLLYEDQRSTVLAVDNLNGFVLLGRTIRVDHVKDYKMPGAKKQEEEGQLVGPSRNAAPALIDQEAASSEEDHQELDLADPMASYIAASKKEKSGSREEKEERRKRKEERKRKREERERRKGDVRDADRSSSSKRRRSEEVREQSRGSREREEDKTRTREHAPRDASHDRDRPRYPADDFHRDERRRDYDHRDHVARDDDGRRRHAQSTRDDRPKHRPDEHHERQSHRER